MSNFGGWSRNPEGVPCVETIKLVDKLWRREGKKDAMLLVMIKQMELLTSYMKGFHDRYSQANHDYDDVYYGNQGWNNARLVDTSVQGSNESIPPYMESTLEVVLEKQLEERMNELASQMAAQTIENSTAPIQDIIDNDIFEWEVGELIADVFLKGDEINKEKCIHAKAQFDAESFKTACPDIYHQIETRDCRPFMILVDPYLPELVQEFYTSYRARKQLMKNRGCTKAFPCLTSPAKDKLASLCSTVDVLESEVGTLKKEVVALTAPPSTSQPNPCEPEAMPEAPRNLLDD
ncbi:hypothetical protein HAX54_051869 [Datura stramonium]|uniref:Uncharacterized protein n=1 Tax=Datura stramonium TaxID=4076 RepID=A0ABS8WQ12_DATST|nr:hypothetical protein [Datura stramonium]